MIIFLHWCSEEVIYPLSTIIDDDNNIFALVPGGGNRPLPPIINMEVIDPLPTIIKYMCSID